MDNTKLVKMFDNDMYQIYVRAKKECNYNASRYLQMLDEKRGINTARTLLWKSTPSDGFMVLWKQNRLDLTVEALILKPDYNELFTDEERIIALNRLKEYGYKPE